MPKTTAPADPRDLILQAAEAITAASDCLGDDDEHLGLMYAIELNWDATDRRWAAALALIQHDNHAYGAIMHEALGLLVTITDRVEEALLDASGPRDDVAQVAREAREMRDAYARLGEIVHAVTAMPLLGEHAR